MGIARFDKTRDHSFGHSAHWPDSPEKTKTLFDGRKPYRKIVIMVDHELLGDESERKSDSVPDKQILLKSLLYGDMVECYRYAVGRPPETAIPLKLKSRFPEEPIYIGYAILYPKSENGHHPITYCLDEKSATYSGVDGLDTTRIARSDTEHATYVDEHAADKREADVLALQVAQKLNADIFVTERPYLFSESGIVSGRGVTVLKPDDAITALSLYYRSQGEFIIPTGSKTFTMHYNRGLFYWVGVRELLPEAWRWFSACVHHSSGTKNDKLSYLGGATLSRMQRAIELRDQVHIAANMETNNDTNDLALMSLDNALLSIMGAIDSAARVAHYVLGFDPSRAYQAAWQKDKWTKQVRKACPDLAKVVAKNSHHYHAMTILSKLRNSIHGEPIRAITKQDFAKKELVIALPKDDEAQILAAMDALDGRAAWGVKQLSANFNELDPGMLIDRLLEVSIDLLNDLMRETPVENLSHIPAELISSPPGKHKSGDPFTEWSRVNIRWQLGFQHDIASSDGLKR